MPTKSIDPKELTAQVKALARNLGSEMTGVASVDRFAQAPLLHSPQGIMPTAQSVVVFGVSWLDAAMELNEKELSEYFYNVGDVCEQETNMNARLYTIALKTAKFLEASGYESIVFPPTNYWRWRPYKSVEEPMAPPIAHRYAAVAAGLGEIGWHESFISPTHGPWVRLNSIITEAPLIADPLYAGPALCDKCMRCVKACPYDRFRKEVRGTKELDIGGKKFTIPLTNKWRCFLCYTHMNPRFLPKTITEDAVLRIIRDGRVPLTKNKDWIKDSAACLAACMPRHLRTNDESLYPNSVARKRTIAAEVTPDDALIRIKDMALSAGMDCLMTVTRDDLLRAGIDMGDYMPRAASAVFFATSFTHQVMERAARERVKNLLFDISHYLQDFGYYTLPVSRISNDVLAAAAGITEKTSFCFHHLLTEMPLPACTIRGTGTKPVGTTPVTAAAVKAFGMQKGADLIGIASVARIEKMTAQLQTCGLRETTIPRNNSYSVGDMRRVEPKRPSDHLPGARSVIVIADHYPYALAERAGKPPAENFGFFKAVDRYLPLELLSVAFDVIKYLTAHGYAAVATLDLDGTAARFHTGNRIPAIAAGLGEIGWNGAVLTPKYGSAQVFISIVTDAPLEEDELYRGAPLCTKCFHCVDTCPVHAISKTKAISFTIENRTFTFGDFDRPRCEWATKYRLVGAEGPAQMNSNVDIMPPDTITPQALQEALGTIEHGPASDRFLYEWSAGESTWERCICPCRGLQNTAQ